MELSSAVGLRKKRYLHLSIAVCLLAFFAISASTAVLEENAQASPVPIGNLLNRSCDSNRPPLVSEIKMTPNRANMHWPVGTYTVPFYPTASVDISDDNKPYGFVEPTSIGEVYLAPLDADPNDPNVDWELKQTEELLQLQQDPDIQFFFVDMEWAGQYKIVIEVTDGCGAKVTRVKTGLQAVQ